MSAADLAAWTRANRRAAYIYRAERDIADGWCAKCRTAPAEPDRFQCQNCREPSRRKEKK